MLTSGKSMTTITSVAAAVALALTLTACGSQEAGEGGAGSASGSSSPTTSASPTASPSPTATNQGIIPDDLWATTVKKAVPPLADVPNDDLIAAGKKLCADFTAAPTTETARAAIAQAESTWKLDSTQANLWTGSAVARFCNDQGAAFLKASVG